MKPNLTQLNALLVDDERLARTELARMLKAFPQIHICGEASDVPSAEKILQNTPVDVVFLDIQMPGQSGFSLLKHLTPDQKVIFVTAFDNYAIRAFEINALDYLLKPFSPQRLEEAIHRLSATPAKLETAFKKIAYDDRLFISVNSDTLFLKISDIISIHAAGSYSEILTVGVTRKGLTNKSMKEWEARLPATNFVRIHRSTIVNMDYIIKTEEWFDGSRRVYVKQCNEPLTMSRRYTAKLKSLYS